MKCTTSKAAERVVGFPELQDFAPNAFYTYECSWELSQGPAPGASTALRRSRSAPAPLPPRPPSLSPALHPSWEAKAFYTPGPCMQNSRLRLPMDRRQRGIPTRRYFFQNRRACSWCVADALWYYTTWWATESCSGFLRLRASPASCTLRCSLHSYPCAAQGQRITLKSSCSLAHDVKINK